MRLFLLVSAIAVSGCLKSPEGPGADRSKASEQAAEAIPSGGSEMFLESMESRLDVAEAVLLAAENRMGDLEGEALSATEVVIADGRSKLEATKSTLADLRSRTGDAWIEGRVDFERHMAELESALTNVDREIAAH